MCVHDAHWCIKLIYNGFAIAIDCTLKVVHFGFCSVQVMSCFRISFWFLRRSDKKSACNSLQLFGDLGIFEPNLYTSQPPGPKIAVSQDQPTVNLSGLDGLVHYKCCTYNLKITFKTISVLETYLLLLFNIIVVEI